MITMRVSTIAMWFQFPDNNAVSVFTERFQETILKSSVLANTGTGTNPFTAYIQPVPKKDDRCNPSNCRLITLTSCLSIKNFWYSVAQSFVPKPTFLRFLSFLVLLYLFSDHSIAALVNGLCSSPKIVNSGIPQGSTLLSTLFLLLINDLLNQTSCPIHSHTGDVVLHFSTSHMLTCSSSLLSLLSC